MVWSYTATLRAPLNSGHAARTLVHRHVDQKNVLAHVCHTTARRRQHQAVAHAFSKALQHATPQDPSCLWVFSTWDASKSLLCDAMSLAAPGTTPGLAFSHITAKTWAARMVQWKTQPRMGDSIYKKNIKKRNDHNNNNNTIQIHLPTPL